MPDRNTGGDLVRIAIVGGGLAGAMLAWRLTRPPNRIHTELFVGAGRDRVDATGASGGLVRGFEADPELSADAADSLAELVASPMLRSWARFREVGSVFAVRPGGDPGPSLAVVEATLPGSARLCGPLDLPSVHPLRRLADAVICVVEPRAGYLSPQALRNAALRQSVGDGAVIRPDTVRTVTAVPTVALGDGTTLHFDAVVLAAGPWTPAILVRSGLPAVELRTGQIQYVVRHVRLPGVGAFVEESSGLYGRSAEPAGFLLGLPCERADADPDTVCADAELTVRVLERATEILGPRPTGGPPDRVVTAVDCYTDPPGLRLRSVQPRSGLYTFSGGSGRSAKTVLAASRAAAALLAC